MKRATGSEIRGKKKVASHGNRLPNSICDGEILIDNAENRWKLGRSIGVQGSAEVYLASSKTDEPVGSDAQHIVKVEPHENGSLFMEINCCLRMARSDIINKWKKDRNLKHVGLFCCMGSGSHVYGGVKYRFIVLERYGHDLGKLFLESGRRFPVKTVYYIGIQILDTLEYIHSRGYIHAHIKGPNLLLGYRKGTENCVYLSNFGRACRYLDRNGVHKEYGCDQSIVHAGSLEYTSRDAHVGAFSRRGDLEMLGYNMLQWLCGKLPWEDTDDPEYINFQKNGFMSNISLLMLRCFPGSEPPAVLSQYLQHVASLGFETAPDYAYCRKLLMQGIDDSGCVNDGKLVFGDSPISGVTETNDRGNKLKATEDPENKSELKPEEKICNNLQQPYASSKTTRNSQTSSVLPSLQQFSSKKIIPVNPETDDSEQVMSNCVMQKFTESSLEVSEPTKPSQLTAVTSSFSNPTRAMLKIMSKTRQKASTPAAHRSNPKWRSKKRCLETADDGGRLRNANSQNNSAARDSIPKKRIVRGQQLEARARSKRNLTNRHTTYHNN
ncbi:Serine/threonine-protein kinase VRK1 [Cryptotermes secundus]|uniref:Serine/threonine-protein kinase VRK1 n=1 Tax=Cryptotermes secundus TaxID=105785 RepID=A0A2J7PJI0_9NEOP|nr:Serine/threonine-protein kinase VRK1 [Cryptotermes secundus]